MMPTAMTSMQRVVTTLGHQEPDRVPLFLTLTMHGAMELGLSIREYFSDAQNVVEGQLRLRARFDNDCLMGVFCGAIEMEPFGGEVIYRDDGPPNAGEPIIRRAEDIGSLVPPEIETAPGLIRVLTAIEGMKERVGDEVPIVGFAVSPFSLPVMQMGFDRYIELMYEQPDLFWQLMKINEEFSVNWANAQLRAGATFVCYFDPISSPTIIPAAEYLSTGFKIASRTLARIEGPTATHMASGRALAIVDDIARTGTAGLACSALEDLSEVKAACKGKITVLGNLNGIEMRRWTPAEAEEIVKDAIAKAGPGGGFILSDNHGEIPWQVPFEVLQAISEAVKVWGRYPLEWT